MGKKRKAETKLASTTCNCRGGLGGEHKQSCPIKLQEMDELNAAIAGLASEEEEE